VADMQVSGLALDLKALKAGVDDSTRILQRLDDRVDSLEKEFDQTTRTASRLGSQILKLAGAFFGLYQIKRAGKYVFETNVEFQKLEATLKTVEGSAFGAERAFDLITKFAVETPFEVQNLTQSFTQLRIRGVNATENRLRGLGNTSAAFTEDITRLTDAIVSAANGMSRPIRQFGFDIERSGDQVKISFGGIERTIAGTAEEISKFVAEIGNTRFADAMRERMLTLDGAISNLKDSTDLLTRKLGRQGLNAELTDLVRTLDQAIQDGDAFAEILGRNLAGGARIANEALEAFIDHMDAIVIAFQAIAGAALARGLVALTAKIATLTTTTAGLSTALSALGGPVGAILTLAGAIGGPLLLSMISAKSEAQELAGQMATIRNAALEIAPEDLPIAIERARRAKAFAREKGGLTEPLVRMIEAGTMPEHMRANLSGYAEIYENFHQKLQVLLELQREYERISSEARAEAASDAYDRFLSRMDDELTKLRQGERAMLEQQLVREGLTEAQRRDILAKYDAIEALEREQKAAEDATTAEQDRLDAIESLISGLEDQHRQLTMSSEAYIRYQLSARGATRAEIAHAMELAHSIEAYQKHQDELARAEQERIAALEAEFNQIKNAADRMADAISQAFMVTLSDIRNVEDAFANLIDTILAETMRLVARKTITEPIANFLVGILTGLTGGGGGGGGGGIEWQPAGPTYAAAGATASAGQPFIVGERGPELFVPRVAGEIIPNGNIPARAEGVVVHQQFPIVIHAIDSRDVIQFFEENKGLISAKALEGILDSEAAMQALRRR